MKSLYFSFALSISIIFPGMGGVIQDLEKKPQKASSSKTPSTPETSTNTFGFTEFGIETTLEYGPSPVYDLIIKSDGTIVYNGYDKTKTLGRYEGNAGSAFFERLAQYANDFNLMKLEDHYESKQVATCGSPSFIYLNLNGQKKIICDNGGAPSSLWAFEYLLSSIPSEVDLRKPSSENPIAKKLDQIHFKKITFGETDLKSLLEQLGKESREADPEKKGVKFKMDDSVSSIKEFTFEDSTLADVIKKLTLLYKLDYEIQDSIVVIKAKPPGKK